MRRRSRRYGTSVTELPISVLRHPLLERLADEAEDVRELFVTQLSWLGMNS